MNPVFQETVFKPPLSTILPLITSPEILLNTFISPPQFVMKHCLRLRPVIESKLGRWCQRGNTRFIQWKCTTLLPDLWKLTSIVYKHPLQLHIGRLSGMPVFAINDKVERNVVRTTLKGDNELHERGNGKTPCKEM